MSADLIGIWNLNLNMKLGIDFLVRTYANQCYVWRRAGAFVMDAAGTFLNSSLDMEYLHSLGCFVEECF